jgi:hypothetical protein
MKRIFITLLLLALAGCDQSTAPDIATENQASSSPVEEFFSKLSAGERLLAIANQGSLELVSPEQQLKTQVYQFDNNQPSRLSLDSFLTSPDGKFVVWYAPTVGIMSLNVREGQVEIISAPTEWFTANPFLVMDDTQNQVSYIDNEGKTRFNYNLDTKEINQIEIPYPYGTRFVISPDKQKTVYIAGFGQSQGQPSFLLTNNQTNTDINFTTQSELADRNTLVFTSDSQAFVVIEDGHFLMKYPVDNVKIPQIFANLSGEGRIVDLVGLGELIFVKLVGGDLLVLDRNSGANVNRIPGEIVEGLNRAQIIPWSKDKLIIYEVLSSFEEQFSRLWVSDFRGNKKILVPEFYRISQVTPEAIPNN